MSQKRLKRIKDTNLQYEQAIREKLEAESLENRPDEDIFVIDRVGSKTKKRKIQQQVQQQESGIVSLVEKKLIEKIVKNPGKGTKKIHPSHDHTRVQDLWQDSSLDDTAIAARPDSKKANIHIPVPGQSYNPSMRDHQEVLSKALEVEIKRRDREAKLRTPFVLPAPTETTTPHSEDEDDEEGSVDDEAESSSKPRIRDRLTRTQRNKQKNKKESAHQRDKLSKESDFLKSISKLPTIVKELDEDEKQRELLKEHKKKAIPSTSAEPTIDPSLVPLSDELTGSLRKIIPKGIALKVQSLEMTTKGMLMARDRRRRQKKDKPHGAKKVVWIPKYKYK
jgi:hypothetical protein